MEAVPVDPLAGPVKSHAAKPQAKPAAKPDDKAAPAAEAKARPSAKTAIPDLRQAALNY